MFVLTVKQSTQTQGIMRSTFAHGEFIIDIDQIFGVPSVAFKRLINLLMGCPSRSRFKEIRVDPMAGNCAEAAFHSVLQSMRPTIPERSIPSSSHSDLRKPDLTETTWHNFLCLNGLLRGKCRSNDR
jgi:hypothetical protein